MKVHIGWMFQSVIFVLILCVCVYPGLFVCGVHLATSICLGQPAAYKAA